MNTITHVHGDGVFALASQPPASVDLILCDPPYGITANTWDVNKSFDLEQFWEAAFKAAKPTAPILVFGNPPFSYQLLQHKLAAKWYRYDWIWQKERGSNFQHANRQPMKVHEHVHVFYKKQPVYNPIKTDLDQVLVVKPKARAKSTSGLVESSASLYHPGGTYVGKFPVSVLKFSRDRPMVHPTQKPVALCEYLIKTYTNPGALVFDPFAGYATVALACHNLGNRSCVSVELDADWHGKGKKRLEEANESNAVC